MTTMFIINKDDLAKKIREEYGCSGHDCKEIVTDIFNYIAEDLHEGKTVSINGFGKFEVKERAARMGINPSTGEKMAIEASNTLTFKPSKTFKDAFK